MLQAGTPYRNRMIVRVLLLMTAELKANYREPYTVISLPNPATNRAKLHQHCFAFHTSIFAVHQTYAFAGLKFEKGFAFVAF